MSDTIQTPEAPAAIKPDSRLSLRQLLEAISETVPSDLAVDSDSYFQADPAFIEQGLYIDPASPSCYSRPHVSRIQVSDEADDGRNMAGMGVVFPATEYAIIERITPLTADQLAARKLAQANLMTTLAYERQDFVALYRDLTEPHRGRYKAKNLDQKRVRVDEKFHETLEVAAGTLEFEDTVLKGAHWALRQSLNGGNFSADQLTSNWLRHLIVAGRHNTAKTYKLRHVISQTARDIVHNQLYTSAESYAEAIAA